MLANAPQCSRAGWLWASLMAVQRQWDDWAGGEQPLGRLQTDPVRGVQRRCHGDAAPQFISFSLYLVHDYV